MISLVLTGSVDQILAGRSYFVQWFWTEAHLFLQFGPFGLCDLCTAYIGPYIYVHVQLYKQGRTKTVRGEKPRNAAQIFFSFVKRTAGDLPICVLIEKKCITDDDEKK